MQLIPKNTPISLENAADLLPLIAKQSKRAVGFVESPRGGWTYSVDGKPSGLRCETEAAAMRSACRLLLREKNLDAFLDDQTAKLTAKVERQCEKGCRSHPRLSEIQSQKRDLSDRFRAALESSEDQTEEYAEIIRMREFLDAEEKQIEAELQVGIEERREKLHAELCQKYSIPMEGEG